MAIASKSARQRAYHSLIASRYLSQHALLLGANLATGVFGYLLHAVLGRLLGPSNYGTVASLIALSSVLLFPTQVITTVMARFGAMLSVDDHAGQIHDLMRRLTAILLPIGVIMALVCLLASRPIALFLHLDSALDIVFLGIAFTVAFVTPINLGVMQGLQRFGAFSTFLVLPALLRFVLASVLVMLGFGVRGAILGITMSVILSCGASFQPVQDLLRGPRESAGSLRPLQSYGLTTGVALASTVLLYNLDTLLAKHFLTDQSAGLYAALATVGKIVLVVGNGVVMAMFPRFTALHSRGENPLRTILGAAAAVICLSLVVEVPFVLAPVFAMRVLIGASFTDVAGQLGLYGCAMLLFAVAQVFIYYFLANGHRLFMLTVLGCCALQIVLFAAWHDSVTHMVEAVLLSKILLISTLVYLFITRRRYEQA